MILLTLEFTIATSKEEIKLKTSDAYLMLTYLAFQTKTICGKQKYSISFIIVFKRFHFIPNISTLSFVLHCTLFQSNLLLVNFVCLIPFKTISNKIYHFIDITDNYFKDYNADSTIQKPYSFPYFLT